MDEKFYEELKEKILPYFKKVGSHAFDHTLRVYNLALKISRNEEVDLDIVKASALLHDIARLKQDRRECDCHAEEGAKIAEKILNEMNFPRDKIGIVCKCIALHSKQEDLPEIKELRILKEADGLDATGAIGIARIFSYDGEKSSWSLSFSEYLLKIFKRQMNSDYFQFPIARELSKERTKIMEEFLQKFISEWNGEL